MIMRLTQKLAKKVKVGLTESLPLHPDPLADWSANLFTMQRYQFIMFTNTATLYSAVIRGAGVNDGESLVAGGLQAVRAQMLYDGFPITFYDDFIAPHGQRLEFSKSANRAVLGSMNDGIHLARAFLIEPSATLLDGGEAVNRAPMSVLGMGRPKETLLTLLVETAAREG